MESRLELVLADIFMTELEKMLLTDIYIRDGGGTQTMLYPVKIGSIKHTLCLLNSFDEKYNL